MDNKKKGERLEVRIYDEEYSPFYKRKVLTKNKKELNELIQDLEHFGINLRGDKPLSSTFINRPIKFFK